MQTPVPDGSLINYKQTDRCILLQHSDEGSQEARVWDEAEMIRTVAAPPSVLCFIRDVPHKAEEEGANHTGLLAKKPLM